MAATKTKALLQHAVTASARFKKKDDKSDVRPKMTTARCVMAPLISINAHGLGFNWTGF